MKIQLSQISDRVLLDEVKRLVQCEREATASLVAHLAEVYRRRIYCAEGCSSMFTYCTQVLRLSENAAYRRIAAAQMACRYPTILVGLENGTLNLTAIRLLAPYLSAENFDELLDAARGRSKREIEHLLAHRFPRPDVPDLVRKLPERSLDVVAHDPGTLSARPVLGMAPALPAPTSGAVELRAEPARRDVLSVVAPLAPERYKVQFTANAVTHEKLRRAQDLLRHRIPNGDVAQVFDLALTALIEKLEKQRLAATDRPQASRGTASGSRVIPAAVKRAVWKRDDGRCAFAGKNGQRCIETGFLEFHHLVPFARGGPASLENISLRCRAHNQYEGRLDFGARDTSIVREADAPWPDGACRDVALWSRDVLVVRESNAPWVRDTWVRSRELGS